MNILGKELLARTAEFVQSIETASQRPIAYFPNSSRPNQQDNVAGTVDVFPADGTYKVYLENSLPADAFEVDLLHELRHIAQRESGFSHVFNKDTAEFHSEHRAFIQEVGSHLASVVLDFEVNTWLVSQGYSHSFFTKNNYKAFLQSCGVVLPGLADPLNFANFALGLLHSTLYVDDSAANTLFAAYHAYPEATAVASNLRTALFNLPLNTPQGSLLGHCLLIDTLNLWGYHYAAVPGRKVRTHREYSEFLAHA